MGFAGGPATPWVLALLVILLTVCIPAVRSEAASGGKGRSLLGFRETLGNVSFQCSPSGPCIPCEYSEKNDEKFRCSETGYRLPLKCVETRDVSTEESKSKNQRKLLFQSGNMAGSVMREQLVASVRNLKFRKLMNDSSTSESGKQSYITYRSCIPVDGEENLSVLGFEVSARSSMSAARFGQVLVNHGEIPILIMVCLLLISGPVVYLRQKRPVLMPGAGATRIPTNSPRF
ncbi:hypothetical protein MA16_Dca015687 [Dendrobium catenatum]|uniref:Structural polyprotein n=1 Tax=Dendrobium catenatum TaxID=906689 RepID=A0A2I0V8G4_9ASPA|nr:hypothetical protein MA16_Dca015687 [Dendrobium catenatum]